MDGELWCLTMENKSALKQNQPQLQKPIVISQMLSRVKKLSTKGNKSDDSIRTRFCKRLGLEAVEVEE